MSLFYRGSKNRSPIYSRSIMRVVTSLALVAYPAGCMVRLLMPDTSPQPGLTTGEIIGFALILVSLASFVMILPSNLQRIIADEKAKLDEFELDLRRRANGFAYQFFGSMTLIGILYMSIAVDTNRLSLWVPTSYDHWNAIMWGAVLYAVTLPTAYLAWFGPKPIMEEEEPA
jgi:hypothetical protein